MEYDVFWFLFIVDFLFVVIEIFFEFSVGSVVWVVFFFVRVDCVLVVLWFFLFGIFFGRYVNKFL